MNARRVFGISMVASLLTAATLVALLSFGSVASAQRAQSPSPVPATESGPVLGETGDGNPAQGSTDRALPQAGADSNLGPAAPNLVFRYAQALGVNLQPRTSTTTYAYNFDGCVYLTGGTDNRLMFPVHVPDGATLKYLRLYADDTSASTDLTAWLTRYQPGVTSVDLTSVTSVGSAGFGTWLSAEITHTVDLANWSYQLIVAPNVNAVTNSICGLRVAYYAQPGGALFMPTLQKK